LPSSAEAQQAAAPVPGSTDSQEKRTEEQTAAGQVGLPDDAPTQSPGPGQVGADGESAELGDIVVTGIRRGIADSIDLKRRQDSIVEAVSAEDIGKLPDVSIAESIARLPGLATQRVAGRAQTISIRGLAPDFTTTLLNGRQQASSGDNRSVEFDQYPAELLASVVVYKTPDARLAGFGLSGTADLRTVRPLEFGKRAIALNVRGELNDFGKLNDDVDSRGYRASVSYIDQFANGTLGLALGYARLDQPSGNRHFKSYNYEAFSGEGSPTDPFVSPAAARNALLVNGQEVFVTSRRAKRDAFIGILEWQPSSSYHATLDGYYSRFDQNEVRRGAQWFSNPFADDARFTNVVAQDSGGTLIGRSGTANRVVPILRNDANDRKDELVSVGLNNEFTIDPTTRVALDLSYSNNKRRESFVETYAGYGLGVGGVSPATPNAGRTFDAIGFTTRPDDFPTYSEGLDYADASRVSLGDRAPWGGWGHDGRVSLPDVEESVYAVDLGFSKDVEGFFSGVDLGVNYTRREKSKFVYDADLFLSPAGVVGGQQVLVDPRFLKKPTSLGFAGFGDVLSYDPRDLLDTYYTQRQIQDANFFDKNWDISEDVFTMFAKTRIDWGRLRGNAGVQVIAVKQRSTGVVINNTGSGVQPQPITDGAEYSNVLPSVNLIYDLGGGHRFRAAASKTLARPRMDEMRANVTPSFNTFACQDQPCTPGTVINAWSANGGNAQLRPWRANALDLAYEWYINPTTYLSIAGFYKDLKTYIYSQTLTFDFTGIPRPAGANAIPADVIVNPLGPITRPANGQGGTVKGLEFSGSFNFGVVASALDGFGATGSLSLTKSDINTSNNPDPDQKVRIAGLSGTVYNLTGYYDKSGFQARINYRYRSGFKGEVVQLFATRGATEILADKQVDAQIGYTFQEGSSLAGLGFQLQVYNLTNSPYRTRLGLDFAGPKTADGDFLLQDYEEYGRNFLFGVNYRF
jgi:iron complex outermembrane receptor protein